jgi:succinyl-CoA synthetase alpha subunit
MSILVDTASRVVVQGLTGKEGTFHALACREYGTRIVAGVTPGKGGIRHEGIPVFNSVVEAVAAEGANTSLIFVPPAFAAEAILEAADAGVRVIVAVTEGIPALDMVRVARALAGRPLRLVGPNCPGVISPGQAKVGIMPARIHLPGRVGVISRSGTLTYEAVGQLTARGIGQSTCVGIGGDPIIGTSFVDALDLFQEDPATDAILMIGEIGGTAEEDAAAFVRARVTKPVVGFICGQTAPPGRRMGHAGAIISGGTGTAAEKMAAMRAAGITVVASPAEMGEAMADVLAPRARTRRAVGTPTAGRGRPAAKSAATARGAAKAKPPAKARPAAKPAARPARSTKAKGAGSTRRGKRS